MSFEEEEKKPLLSTEDDGKKPYDGGGSGADDKKDKKEGKKSASFGELFRYATALDNLLMLVGSLFALVTGGGWPVMAIIFGEVTDTFVRGIGNDTNSSTYASDTEEEFSENMTKYAYYYLYLAAAILVAAYFQIMCWTSACERQVHKMRRVFFKAISRQEIGWFDEHQSGELTTRLAGDLEKVKDGLGDKFSFALQYTAQFLSGFGIGFWKGWKMALVMMSLTPLLAIAGALMSSLMRNMTNREQEIYASSGSVAEEVLSCIRTVISFNGQRQEVKRYEKALRDSAKMGIRKAYAQGLLIGTTMLIMFGTYALAFWYGSEQVKDFLSSGGTDGISPGEVITVFFCVMIGSFSIGNAAPHLGSIFGAKGAAAFLFEVIDNKPVIDASSDKGQCPDKLDGDIDFVGVQFTYPTRKEVKVLKDFNLSVKRGQTVALVGASGCGKSTSVNLIQRFYDPDEGQVLLDGVNLKDLNVKWLRSNIGIVSQEPILFGFSILENIKLGYPDATMQEVERAAKEANAHDFITGLPKGYNTLVGERGAQLSGGQKQRVAIARALIRNPRILLLDEATSALDSESEKTVQAALDKARQGRTTIMIAHRLSTIQNADMIYVLDAGELKEQGTHMELMDKNELYYQLVMAQALQEGDDGNPDVIDLNVTDSELDSPTKRQRNTVSISSDKSDGPRLKHQMSRQISRQVSHKPLKEKDGEKKEEEEIEKEEAEPPKYFRLLRANFPECGYIIFGCIASAIQGATMPLFAIFFSEMIKVFINAGENSLFWSMMFLALGGGNFLTNMVMNASFGHSGCKMTMRLRLKTFQSYLRQDASYFDDPRRSTGALTTRLATDAAMIQTATGYRIGTIFSSIVSLVAALVIAFIYGWKLALAILGAVPILMLASSLQMRVVLGRHKGDQSKLEEAGKTAAETIENIRTVQSLCREKYFYNIYLQNLKGPLRSSLIQAQLYGLAYGFSQAVLFGMYGGAFRFGAWQVSLGDMEPENVYKVFFAIAFTGMTIAQASSFLPDYSKAKHSAAIIFKVMDTVPAIDVYSNKGTYLNKVEGNIVFKGVNFCYPMRQDFKVLKDLSFKVEAGKTVALVGQSGCGKSTIISLLQRFYDPENGTITVDGYDIRDLHLARLRSFLSVVSQEPILFDCSIRDNIVYGLEDPVGMDEVIAAARAANIHEFIAELPIGYDTTVGEKGTQLSGGQKQRVAIARALIRNPRILLLDEATSALDSESEKLVQSALDNAQEGRTCIVIAHRLSTIQNADEIFVIDNGQVVEKGTHQQLLAQKGVYSALVSAQQFTN